MDLHRLTIKALEYKAGVAHDSIDPADPESDCWIPVERACRFVAQARTVDALAGTHRAKEELENYLDNDMSPAERRAIKADLCRAGWYPVHDPSAVSTRRLRTMKVDGVRYEVE